MAVDEVLDPAGGSDVVFVAVLGELEGGAELGVQFVGVVAHDWQAAAFGRAVGGEGGDDHVAAVADRLHHLAHVGAAGFGSGKEVEHGAVVPDIIGGFRQVDAGNVAGDPAHLFAARAEAVAGDAQGGVGKVEHRQVAEAFGEQAVDQGRGAAADIDDRRLAGRADASDQVEGQRGLGLEPAHRVGRLALVYPLPVLSFGHDDLLRVALRPITHQGR